MKRLVLAVLAVTSLSAMGAPLTDVHGNVHYKGYTGHKTKLTAEPTWEPTAAQVAALPDHYDLRTLGFVAPVRDQGQCGSCWAHSLVKSLESSRLLHGKPYLDLSEQDEMMNGDGDACNGGTMDGAHLVNHGSTLEKKCPYIARAKSCRAPSADHGAAWAFIGTNATPTVDDLRAAIFYHGVISVTVAAGGIDWQGGNGGHMTDCSNTGLDHMVNLIGYIKAADGTYTFIGRNSWGKLWGDGGDFYAKAGPGGCDQLAYGPYSALYIDASK